MGVRQRSDLASGGCHPKQREIDRLGHGPISGVARMQVVAAVVRRQEARRMGGIARHPVEIDHAVERFTRPNPLVDRFPLRLPGGRVVAAPLVWRERSAVDPNSRRAVKTPGR